MKRKWGWGARYTAPFQGAEGRLPGAVPFRRVWRACFVEGGSVCGAQGQARGVRPGWHQAQLLIWQTVPCWCSGRARHDQETSPRLAPVTLTSGCPPWPWFPREAPLRDRELGGPGSGRGERGIGPEAAAPGVSQALSRLCGPRTLAVATHRWPQRLSPPGSPPGGLLCGSRLRWASPQTCTGPLVCWSLRLDTRHQPPGGHPPTSASGLARLAFLHLFVYQNMLRTLLPPLPPMLSPSSGTTSCPAAP